MAGSGGTALGWHVVNINEVFAGIDMGNRRGPSGLFVPTSFNVQNRLEHYARSKLNVCIDMGH